MTSNGRLPEKAFTHQNWPPIAINTAKQKKYNNAMCSVQKEQWTQNIHSTIR